MGKKLLCPRARFHDIVDLNGSKNIMMVDMWHVYACIDCINVYMWESLQAVHIISYYTASRIRMKTVKTDRNSMRLVIYSSCIKFHSKVSTGRTFGSRWRLGQRGHRGHRGHLHRSFHQRSQRGDLIRTGLDENWTLARTHQQHSAQRRPGPAGPGHRYHGGLKEQC